jgi:hypothetical protein
MSDLLLELNNSGPFTDRAGAHRNFTSLEQMAIAALQLQISHEAGEPQPKGAANLFDVSDAFGSTKGLMDMGAHMFADPVGAAAIMALSVARQIAAKAPQKRMGEKP